MQNPPLLSILMLAYEDLGAWKIRVLDATNHPRPQVETAPVGYVHCADGMNRASGCRRSPNVLVKVPGRSLWRSPRYRPNMARPVSAPNRSKPLSRRTTSKNQQ